MTLTAAQEARTNNALDKLMRFSFGVMSWRQAIERGHLFDPHTELEPSVKYSRTKFNRMNHAEQREYEKKLETMKPAYYLRHKSDPRVAAKCPKLVFAWAAARGAANGDNHHD